MTEPTTPTPKAPSVWSKPGTMASLILISLVVVAAAALATGAIGRDDTDAPAEPGEPTTAASEASPDVSASAADDAEDALTVAPEVEWKPEHGGILLPYSSLHGPAVVADDGVASGFTNSSAGALLAAVHIALRSSAPFDDAVQAAVIEQQVAPGPDQETLLAAVGADEEDEAASAADLAVVCAYAIHSWTETESVVEVVLDAGDGQYISFLFTLSWTGTDWQMAAPPAGTWATVARQVPSLDGFIAWGP